MGSCWTAAIWGPAPFEVPPCNGSLAATEALASVADRLRHGKCLLIVAVGVFGGRLADGGVRLPPCTLPAGAALDPAPRDAATCWGHSVPALLLRLLQDSPCSTGSHRLTVRWPTEKDS